MGLTTESGAVSLLRVHEQGGKYGPAGDVIDVEVVFTLDSAAGRAFGFQLRDDENRLVHQGMLDLLRDSVEHGLPVHADVERDDGKQNGIVIRLWLTRSSRTTPSSNPDQLHLPTT